MSAGPQRDDELLRSGLDRWLTDTSGVFGTTAVAIDRPAAGWCNETLLVTTDTTRIVVRLPGVLAAYPDYDLQHQYAVLERLASTGSRVPRPLAYVADDGFVGAPFLVMEHIVGRALDDATARDSWLVSVDVTTRRAVHEQFVDMLGGINTTRHADLELRHGLDAEIAYWSSYLDWASDGEPPRRLRDALTWCAATKPVEPEPGLLWGDARLGNVMYDGGGALVAALDFELASVGPAEMDLAWYLALDAVTTSFMGRNPEGMLGRDEIIARHAAMIGRQHVAADWHEVFALVRSVAVSDRLARLAGTHGFSYPGVAGDANPMLSMIERRIDALR
jgi:aminoglycoside phosphotransferase (APT) family kinase protein